MGTFTSVGPGSASARASVSSASPPSARSYARRPKPRAIAAKSGAAWNVDVVGSYTFLRAFALYGRVGYAQEVALPAATANLLTGDLRRPRDGMNYGLGMRYDVTRALGVNLEYTRFGRIGFESYGSTLPENDQVRLGVQFRF